MNIVVWPNLVRHLLWEQGIGGSNPLTATNRSAVILLPSSDDVVSCNKRGTYKATARYAGVAQR